MKRLFIFIFALFCGVMLIKAEESTVEVQKSEDRLSIYARSYGFGETLEEAKLDAINKIVPQLVHKTQDIPGAMHSYMSANGIETGEGIDNIAGEMVLQGYWELKEEKYVYRLEFLIDNTKEE